MTNTIVNYNLENVMAAAKFVSENNRNHFSYQEIWDSIMQSFKRFSENKDCWFTGTMGYYVIVEDVEEHTDGTHFHVHVLVEPDLNKDMSLNTINEGRLIIVEE